MDRQLATHLHPHPSSHPTRCRFGSSITHQDKKPLRSYPSASVLLLCGLPASGKSSFARKISALHRQHYCPLKNRTTSEDGRTTVTEEDMPVISRFDEILLIDYDLIAQNELLCGKSEGENASDALNQYDSNDLEAWRKSRIMALSTLKNALSSHLAGGGDASSLLIIMDDNFHLRSMRRDVYRTCQVILTPQPIDQRPIRKIGFSTLYFSTPLEVCRERNGLRNGKECVPVDVINRMASTIEPPDETKPYASFECFHVSIDNSQITADAKSAMEIGETLRELDLCLHKALQSPIVPKTELSREELAQLEQQRMKQQEETRKCQMQRIDQLLRKLVGAVGRIEKKRSREANQTRKTIMDTIRKEDCLSDVSDEYITEHFMRLIHGADVRWQDSKSPITDSIKDALIQFQKERNT
ncbi:hypothetical protein ACHAWF_002825 [Thalassiosira exigua]